MAHLSVETLGRFQASYNGTTLTGFRTKKVEALLVYLAVEPAPHTREKLTTLLWPGLPRSSARSNLRQILYLLRQSIAEITSHDNDEVVPLLVANRRIIQLNPEAEITTDVVHLENLLDQSNTHHHPEIHQCLVCRQALTEAVTLYHGPFLSNFYIEDSDEFETWAHGKRTYLRRRVINAITTLINIAINQQAYDRALVLIDRQLQIDNLSDNAHRQKMVVFAITGRHKKALDVYANYSRLLNQELGMAPSAQTTGLYERILAGDPATVTESAQEVHGYDLREQIDQGAYGAVYRAVQTAVGREVAIKVIRREYASDPDFIRSFEAEAQTIARLEHPHIVPLYDYWREPDGAYLVMRYLSAGNLLQVLDKGAWTLNRTVGLVDQIANALHMAHQQGIVHRDIKPSNILLDDSGNAFLSDFGIAKKFDYLAPSQPDDTLSGTLDYTSPEQILNEPVTPQSDIYSLGAVLYETLTGEKPFGETSISDLINSHLNEPLPLVAASRPDVPGDVDAVLQKATAKRPADRFTSVLEMADAYHRAVLGQLVDISGPVETVDEIYNPYKGLRAFQEADADDFFGRDALVGQLIDRLDSHSSARQNLANPHGRFLALVGPSGSGKSSVVKAGLIPALREGALLGSDKWFIAEMVPGPDPFKELQTALWPVAVNPPPDLVTPMQRDNDGLLRTLRRILPPSESAAEEAQLLLIIDQFEELFTLVDDEEQRAFFIDSLLAAINGTSSPLHVVITLRADFYDRPLRLPQLGELLKTHTEIILPLNHTELTWAVREPARRVGVGFEDGLVSAIVADAGDQPGALPLLQYALAELFDGRQGNLMTHTGYEAIGGVQGALGRRAEDLYTGLDETEQATARQFFLRLITLGEGVEDTRRRVLRAELDRIHAGDNPNETSVGSIIEAFGSGRLLTFDHDPNNHQPTVEIAHEALLREWGRLRGWLDECRADVRLQRLLTMTTAEWLAAGRDDGFLLRGARLDQFEGWAETTTLALTADEQAFLDASLGARREREAAQNARRQRELETAQQLAETERQRAEENTAAAASLRKRAIYLGAALVIAAILAIVAIAAGRQSNLNAQSALAEAAQRATAQAEAEQDRLRAESRQLEAEHARATAVAEGVRADQERNAALAAEDVAQSEARVRATAEAQAVTEREEAQRQAQLAAARELAALGSVSLQEDPERTIILALHSLDSVYTPEGESVLRQGLTNSRVRLNIPATTGAIDDVIYNPDGETLIGIETGENDSFVRYWNAQTGELQYTFSCGRLCRKGILSPDGQLLAKVDDESNILILDLQASIESGSPQIIHNLVGHTNPDILMKFGPESSLLATSSFDKSLKVWDLAQGTLLFSEEEPELQWLFTTPTISPDGTMVAASGLVPNTDVGARVYDIASGDLLLQLPSDQRWPSFNPDGRRLITHSWDNRIYIWDLAASLAAENPQELYGFNAYFTGPPAIHALSADGTYLVEEREDIAIWRLGEDSAEQIMVLTGQTGQVPGSSTITEVFHPDGHHLATTSMEGIRVWDVSPSGESEVMTFQAHDDRVESLALNQNGSQLASGSLDGTAALWDAATGEKLQEFTGHENRIRDVVFSPDGTRLLTAGDDGTARLWDVSSGEELARLDATDGGDIGAVYTGVMSARFSPDGAQIVTAAVDGTVRLWDAAKFQELKRWTVNPAEASENSIQENWGVTMAKFSPDGRQLAAVTDGGDGIIKVWNIDDDNVHLEYSLGHRVFDVDFSPDGRKVAANGQIWDLDTGERLLTIPRDDPRRKHYFTNNGQQIVIPVEEIDFFATNSGELLKSINIGDYRSWVFSPDEARLYSGDGEGMIRVFFTDIQDLIDHAWTRATRFLREEECQQYLHLDACPDE